MGYAMARKSDPLAFGGLALLTLIWSFSWIAMKQVTSYIGAFDFTALRCIFGAVVLWIVMLIRGKALKPTPFGYHGDRVIANLRHGRSGTVGANERWRR